MIGTDSHTPNAGGLAMIAVGVGGADAVDVMAGLPWEVKHPKLVGVRLTGKLGGWTAPKDVILEVCRILTVSGGTDRIVEYFGPGASSISATGKGTICNMGAEHGATTSYFPYDARMGVYLRATRRGEIAVLAEKNPDLFTSDEDVERHPEKYFERIIEIDLSKLEPQICGPHTPDLARPVSKMADDVRTNDFPDNLSAALIGSCTNSSYEDIGRVVDVARQAAAAGISAPIPFLVTPGSDQIFSHHPPRRAHGGAREVGRRCSPTRAGPASASGARRGRPEAEQHPEFVQPELPAATTAARETLSFIASPEVSWRWGSPAACRSIR
jgi:aconitate hydratase